MTKLTELELDLHNFERGRCPKPLRPFDVCVKSEGVTTTERVEATSWFAPWCDALERHGLGVRIDVRPVT